VLTTNSDWGTGYCANAEVTNNSTTSGNWNVTGAYQGKVSSSWSANYTFGAGTFSATGLDWNKTLAPGGKAHFGFCANR
jgi:endoglucanase